MASAFAHRLFTRGHVKYVRFHGDRSLSGDGFFAGERVSQSTVFPATRLSIAPSPACQRGVTCIGNRQIKEDDLDSTDPDWGWVHTVDALTFS